MEYTVAAFMHQLFQALEHIHGLEIAHLDIEVHFLGIPENLNK